MEKRIFEENLNKLVTIKMKADGFGLTGVILNVFEDCIEFQTKQRTSYIDLDAIGTLVVME